MVESHDWQYMTKTWRYTEKHLLPVLTYIYLLHV